MFLFFEILESGETDFYYTPLEYQSGIAPKKGAVLLNLFSFKTEGKGLLGKTFSAAAGGSGEDTQTSSGETADPEDPEGQNWDISCTHPWGFPPATPHPHCHGAERQLKAHQDIWERECHAWRLLCAPFPRTRSFLSFQTMDTS